MISKVDGGFVISSGGLWLPGCYDSKKAANYAFRFCNEDLQSLQDELNAKEPDFEKRVITFEMLQSLAKRTRERMNREHKFRAWDKEYAHMYTNAWPFEHLVYVEMPSHDDQCNPLPINGNKFYCVNGKTFYFLTKKHVELMEYTGLKDKRGKEIFEGDILKAVVRNYLGDNHLIEKVYWDEEKAAFGPFHHFMDEENRWMDCDYEVEVIGNIYENNDLLKRGKG